VALPNRSVVGSAVPSVLREFSQARAMLSLMLGGRVLFIRLWGLFRFVTIVAMFTYGTKMKHLIRS
jgi:hypothetical protein